jgi:hypothetical protein
MHLSVPERNMIYYLLVCPASNNKFRLYLVGISSLDFTAFWLQLTYKSDYQLGHNQWSLRENELFDFKPTTFRLNHLQAAFLFHGSSGIYVQNFPSAETLHTNRDGKLELHWVDYLEPIEVTDA